MFRVNNRECLESKEGNEVESVTWFGWDSFVVSVLQGGGRGSCWGGGEGGGGLREDTTIHIPLSERREEKEKKGGKRGSVPMEQDGMVRKRSSVPPPCLLPPHLSMSLRLERGCHALICAHVYVPSAAHSADEA